MRHFFCLVIFYSCMQYTCIAQSDKPAKPDKPDKPTYKTAVGIRFSPFGVSFKTNNKGGKTSFELIGYFNDGFALSGFYYWNFKLNEPGNLKLYAGGGGLAGFKDEDAGGGAVLGISGIFGADYKFLHLPLNISLDWQPSYQIGRDNDFKSWISLAARFTL